MAGREGGGPDQIAQILLDTKKIAQDRLLQLEQEGKLTATAYNRGVRSAIYDDALNAGIAAGLDSDAMMKLTNQAKSLMTDQFPVDMVTSVTDPVTQTITHKLRDDIISTDFDLDGQLAKNIAVIQEQFPAQAQFLIGAAAGMDVDKDGNATPMTGTPDEIAFKKRQSGERVVATLAELAKMENAQHEFEKLELAVNVQS
jgi:hypothetical protein